MENVLERLNWVFLLSHRIHSRRPSHSYRKAWLNLLTISQSLGNEISDSLDAKLGKAMQSMRYLDENYNGATINSLREFAEAVTAQSGKQIRPADANTMVSATQEIIDVLMSG